jgi:DNA ligase-1
VWISPKIVVEIKADEITRSPVHTAGRIMKTSKSGNAQEVDVPGYALRFPRLVGFRDDKLPVDATTLEELIKMFMLQNASK